MGVKQEPVPIRGNAGGLGAWGSGLNKASRQSPHQSRRLYLRGCEGGAVKGMPVTARVGISPGGFEGRLLGSRCRCWERRSRRGG